MSPRWVESSCSLNSISGSGTLQLGEPNSDYDLVPAPSGGACYSLCLYCPDVDRPGHLVVFGEAKSLGSEGLAVHSDLGANLGHGKQLRESSGESGLREIAWRPAPLGRC